MPKPTRRVYSGLDRYDTITDERGRFVEDRLPQNPGKVHAFRTWATISRVTVGVDADALCGATVKAELPVEFDPGDPDVCQTCAAEYYERVLNLDT